MNSIRSSSPHASTNTMSTAATGATGQTSLPSPSTIPGTANTGLTQIPTGSSGATNSTNNTQLTSGTTDGGASQTSSKSSSSAHSTNSAALSEGRKGKDTSSLTKVLDKAKVAYSKVRNLFAAEKDANGNVTKKSGVKRALAKVGLERAWKRLVSFLLETPKSSSVS